MILKRKKALKHIIISISLSMCLYIHFYCGFPYSRPFDDSKLAVEQPSVPDSENGYLHMTEAVGNISELTENQRKFYDDIVDLEKNDKRYHLTDKQASHLKSKYGRKLRALEQSVKYKYFVAPKYNMNFENPEPSEADFIAVNHLSRLEVAFARHDYQKGNAARAINRLEFLMRLGNRLQTAYGSYLPFYIGYGVQSRCLKEINELLNDNLIPENQLPLMIAMLSAPTHLKSGLRHVMKVEYNSAKVFIGTARYDKEISVSNRTFYRLFYRPTRTYKKMYDLYLPYYEWAGSSYSEKPYDKYKYPKTILEQAMVLLSGNYLDKGYLIMSSDSMPHFTLKPYLYETQSLLLRTRIALLLFKKHNHTLPSSLDALVPTYLQAVPRDPFDGMPIRHNPKKNIIYSVGINLKDDGGIANENIFSIHVYKSLRKHRENQKDLVLPILK